MTKVFVHASLKSDLGEPIIRIQEKLMNELAVITINMGQVLKKAALDSKTAEKTLTTKILIITAADSVLKGAITAAAKTKAAVVKAEAVVAELKIIPK